MNNHSKLEDKRKIIRQYIKNNPDCTYKDIRKNTKLKIERIYKNMKGAYEDANVRLSKNLTKRNIEKQKKDVINFIINNPGCTVTEIQNNTKVNLVRIFNTVKNAYEASGIKYPKKNVTSGVMDPSVVKRCHEYEKRILNFLKKIGKVRNKVKTKKGIIDCILNYKGEDFVIEVKDFRGKNNITMHEIKQLISYMEDLKYKRGIIICPRESLPKRKNKRNIYINGLVIQIIPEDEIWGCSINLESFDSKVQSG